MTPFWRDTKPFMVLTLDREEPKPATWMRPETAELARHPVVTETIQHFLGHGRSFPPEILDEELVWQIFEIAKVFGPVQAAQIYREHTPKALRVQCRAVLMNLSRMRRANGGHLPWDR